MKKNKTRPTCLPYFGPYSNPFWEVLDPVLVHELLTKQMLGHPENFDLNVFKPEERLFSIFCNSIRLQ